MGTIPLNLELTLVPPWLDISPLPWRAEDLITLCVSLCMCAHRGPQYTHV